MRKMMRRPCLQVLEDSGLPWMERGKRTGGRLALLGGGGGGDTTSTTINYSKAEAAKRAEVMAEAERVYKATGGQISGSDYPGAKVAPFSQETLAAQQLAMANAGAAQQQVNSINQGVQYGLTGAMDVENNPYLQKAISAAVRPIQQEYTDAGGVMSQIRTGATQAGQYGGTRQGIAEGIAAGRQAQAIGDTSAKIASDAYNKGQETFQKTLTFAPQAMEAGMTPVNWMSSVGAQKENLAQSQADYAANSQMWDLNAPWIPLQNYASIVYGGSAPSTTSTSDSSGNARNPIGQAAGAALTGASLYQMMNA